MAGHSKWKNIQHRKGRQDAKRGKMFTKISKEIYSAVKNGGVDPDTNSRLRLALNKAREANMPSDNIERTIKKASGDDEGTAYEEIIYEGYGPDGVAVMVEVLTDNRNRAAAEVRHIFSKHGGNLGETGCVSFLFERKGLIIINQGHPVMDEEELMLEALEAGAEDVQTEEDVIEVSTDPQNFEAVKHHLHNAGVEISSSEITMLPLTTVQINEEKAPQLLQLIETLEDSDDVQHVHANIEING